MRSRNLWILPALLACNVAGAQNKPNADEQLANAALAERFAQIAQQTHSSGGAVPPAIVRQSAALLEEAVALNPGEPRFGRLLKEAYLTLGGDDGRAGAINALNRYRFIDTDDQDAIIQLIDLYAGSIDTADKKQAYYNDTLGDNNLPAPIKAHVAIASARLARERGQEDLAGKMIESALGYFPLSGEALTAQYAALPGDAKPAPRAAVLLKMLQANPQQPAVMNLLADICADVGLLDPSLDWYHRSYDLSARLGVASDLRAMTDYAAELVIGDQLITASTNVKSLLETDPADAEAGMLGLIIASRSNDPGRIDPAAEIARTALRARLRQLSDQVAGAPGATTQPIDDAGITADVAKIKDSTDANLRVAYVSTLVDLAWVDIYFRAKPADAEPTMKVLRDLLTSDSPTLARLDGWSFLANGKKNEALVKLSASADKEPLAALGVFRINGMSDADTARKLVADHPSGVQGAMIIEAVRGVIARPSPGADGAAVRTELDKFPKNFLDILDNSRSFYAIKAAPVDNKIAYGFDEPILVRVTLTNTGTLDLTVGPTATVRPDLWFDINVRGLSQQSLPGVAIDRLAGRLVLGPKQSTAQVVRVDQGQLHELLTQNPQISFPLYGSVVTNPLTQASGIAPGPAGTREQFSNVIERSPNPLNDQTIQQAFQKAVGGNGAQRLHALDLIGALVVQVRAAKDDKLLPRAQEMIDIVRKSIGDSSVAVRAEALSVTAMLADANVKQGTCRQMLSDSEPAIRALGLCIVQQSVDGKTFKELAGPLAEKDADPIVKQIATAMVAVADLPTTQPSSQPATQQTADNK